MRKLARAVWVALAMVACAPAAQQTVTPPPAEPVPPPEPVRVRHAVEPVRTPQAFRRAVERGTRT